MFFSVASALGGERVRSIECGKAAFYGARDREALKHPAGKRHEPAVCDDITKVFVRIKEDCEKEGKRPFSATPKKERRKMLIH